MYITVIFYSYADLIICQNKPVIPSTSSSVASQELIHSKDDIEDLLNSTDDLDEERALLYFSLPIQFRY